MSGIFDQVDHGRIEPFRSRAVPLSVAQDQNNPLMLELAGSFLYLDDDSTGTVYVRFNSMDSARIPVKGGFSVGGFAYRRIFLDWDAQTGKSVNLVYGSGAQFTPVNDLQNIGSIDSVVQTLPQGPSAAAQFYARSSSGAQTNAIVTPAANVNGVLVFMADVSAHTSCNDTARLAYADDAAAAAVFTTSFMIENTNYSPNAYHRTVAMPFLVPAGKGLYDVTGNTTGFATGVRCIYEVL